MNVLRFLALLAILVVLAVSVAITLAPLYPDVSTYMQYEVVNIAGFSVKPWWPAVFFIIVLIAFWVHGLLTQDDYKP
jgi:predicted membrane protein